MEAAGDRGLKDHVRSNWQNAVLVCRKCSKKLDGGFGPDGDERLAKALRKRLSLKKGRKAAASSSMSARPWVRMTGLSAVSIRHARLSDNICPVRASSRAEKMRAAPLEDESVERVNVSNLCSFRAARRNP